MAGSYNKIILVGNLTRDPEIRYVNNGSAVVKFALAINKRSKNGDGEAMFLDIVAWEKLGEICNTYLKKGMSVLIEGALAIRKYETKDGDKRTAVEVVASTMQMLDSKSRSEGGGGYDRPAPSGGSRQPQQYEEDELGEEIPF